MTTYASDKAGFPKSGHIYSVIKILRKIRATTFTENYGKLRVRGGGGGGGWDE